jgi:hypothetical protein
LRITGKGRLCEAEFWCFFRFQFFCGGEIKNGASKSMCFDFCKNKSWCRAR